MLFLEGFSYTYSPGTLSIFLDSRLFIKTMYLK